MHITAYGSNPLFRKNGLLGNVPTLLAKKLDKPDTQKRAIKPHPTSVHPKHTPKSELISFVPKTLHAFAGEGEGLLHNPETPP